MNLKEHGGEGIKESLRKKNRKRNVIKLQPQKYKELPVVVLSEEQQVAIGFRVSAHQEVNS